MSEYRKVAYKIEDGEEVARIVLRSDGKLFVYGDVVDPEVNFEWNKGSYRDVGRDLQVTDWDTPSGYVLSGWGTVHAFGAAEPVPGGSAPGAATGIKGYDWFRAIMMNPAANGQGYRLRADGLVERFGSTLPPAIGAGPGANAVANGAMIDMVGDLDNWGADMKFFCLDQYGKIWPCNGANSVSGYTGETKGWKAFKYMRSIQVATWDTTTGYVMDVYGRVFSFTNPSLEYVRPPARTPNWRKQGWAVARDFHLIDDSPLEYKLFTSAGATHTVFSSEPATLNVIPPGELNGLGFWEVNDTRNPTIGWNWEDDEGDRPERYELKIFTDAQFLAPGFNVNKTTPLYEYVELDYRITVHRVVDDLPNGAYRAMVRAIEETSGFASDWDDALFFQEVELTDPPSASVTEGTDGMSDVIRIIDRDTILIPEYDATLLTLEVLTDKGWKDALRGLRVALEEAPDPMGGGEDVLVATVTYWEPAQRVASSFRARVYNSDDDGLYSEWVYFSGLVRTPRGSWISKAKVGGTAKQVSIAEFQRANPIISGTMQPIGDRKAIVVTDENPAKGTQGSIKLNVLDPLASEDMWNLIFSGEVLLYRDQFGEQIYFSVVEGVERDRLRAQPLPYESTSIRDAGIWNFGFVEVERPS